MYIRFLADLTGIEIGWYNNTRYGQKPVKHAMKRTTFEIMTNKWMKSSEIQTVQL